MEVKIPQCRLSGTINAIASKSHAHRLLICASLSDGPTDLICSETSADIEATIRCVSGLGTSVTRQADTYHVIPADLNNVLTGTSLDCGESGSTLRFMLPVVCALGAGSSFIAHGRLPQRPLSPLYEELCSHGCTLSKQGDVPFNCAGKLKSGHYTLSADVSSQYISGLLFALPLLEGDSFLELTGTVESRPYIDMTLDALRTFGITVNEGSHGFMIPGSQRYSSPGRVVVEGDWSNAAFWLCAGAVGGGPVTVTNLNMDSMQGDKSCVRMLEKFGADIVYSDNTVTVSGGSLHAIEFDAKDTPDLVPIFALVAAAAQGTTVFTNAQRLRIKESDRLKTVHDMLSSLGADIAETSDGLIVSGGAQLHAASVDSFNDHRIAMTAAVAAQICSGGIEIKCAQAVAKSYPDFYRHYEKLGGTVTGGI